MAAFEYVNDLGERAVFVHAPGLGISIAVGNGDGVSSVVMSDHAVCGLRAWLDELIREPHPTGPYTPVGDSGTVWHRTGRIESWEGTYPSADPQPVDEGFFDRLHAATSVEPEETWDQFSARVMNDPTYGPVDGTHDA